MADYNISAEITADASGFESGIKKAQKASKNLSKSVSGVIQGLGKSGLVGALGAVGLATGGVVTVLNAVTKVAKKVAQTIDECSQAYRVQYQAEVALATAVNNNPYVDGTATKRLKEFASEMQKVSDVGDEQMLPMMADLIAKGRTEEETMQIMKVALDMSAGGAMSLETAITQLNATLNGNVGRLGQQNAELKDLTEEELKQGKAVEILGEKYKGLSKATADSQKQLKNAVGDLKENMGQIFEQALAPMRKFFTEVITNLNNSITKSRELKSSMKEVFGDEGDVNLGASTDALNTAFTEILHKQQEVSKNYRQYIQLYGKYIDVSTDETALSYQSQITTLENQLKEISEELNKRRRESEEEKKRLAQARADEEAEKELEKQKELRAKELVLENEWADKLFAIRLENLENVREKELENEKLTQEEREAIVDFYGEQILAMKIKQLEKEREEALKQENLTEDSRRSINLYYENRITNAKKDEEEKRLKLKKKEVKEEKKEEKSKYEIMLEYAKQYARQIASVFKNIVSNVKNIFSKAGNIFMKIIEFNPDEALDNLLKFEDAILTFFVETLPKLPAFFKSAMQSIIVLIDTVLNVLDFDVITETLSNILQSIITAVSNWIGSGGWKKLLDAFLKLQQMIENVIADNLPAIVDTIVAMLPDLIDMLIASIVSASKTLAKIAKPIIKLVIELIKAIIEVITSDEVMEAGLDAMMALTEAIFDDLLPAIIKLIPNLIVKVIAQVIKNFPKIVKSIIQGLIKSFATLNWAQVVADCFMGFIDAFKDLFGIHSPSTLFESFGEYMIEGLILGIQGMADALNSVLQPIYNLVVNIFGQIGNIITSSISVSFSGLTSLLGGINSGIAQITNSVANLINSLANLISTANQAVSALNPLSGGSSGGGGGSSSDNLFTNPSNPANWIDPIGVRHWFGFANGSQNVPKGLSIVGEAGPELVKFNGGEQVLNNRNTNKALENMGGKTNNFNVTFNNLQDTTAFNMMQQLKAYNRQMAINGVI